MRTVLHPLRRGALACFFVLTSILWTPSDAEAQDWTSIRGIRVVVQVRGTKKSKRDRVGRAVRRRLVEAIGPLVPSRELDRAKRKLKLSGKRAGNPRNLARAGLSIGAEHVIDVYVKANKRGADVRTRIVDVATAEIAFEEETNLGNVKKEAKTKGRAIGERLIAKLEAITQAYGGSVTANPPPTTTNPDATVLPEATITASADPDDGAPFAGDPDAAPPESPPPAAATNTSDPYAGIDDPGSSTTTKNDGVKWFSADGSTSAAPSTNTETNAAPPPTNTAPPTSTYEAPYSEPKNPRELLRLGLGAGAGLARSYTLSTAEGSSSLSYTLDPLSMFMFDFELIVPKVDVGLELSASFRPVAYSVDRGALGAAFPSGLLIDLVAAVSYHADIVGEGRDALRIIPSLGARVVLANVEQHEGNVIPSATTVAVVVGATARYPVNEIFELDGGMNLGLVVSYSETPLGSGEPNGGFTFGLELGARVWVTPYLGITFDNTLTYDTIGFSNIPERPLPPDEVGRLSDVSITIFDVRSSVGVVFRF